MKKPDYLDLIVLCIFFIFLIGIVESIYSPQKQEIQSFKLIEVEQTPQGAILTFKQDDQIKKYLLFFGVWFDQTGKVNSTQSEELFKILRQQIWKEF